MNQRSIPRRAEQHIIVCFLARSSRRIYHRWLQTSRSCSSARFCVLPSSICIPDQLFGYRTREIGSLPCLTVRRDAQARIRPRACLTACLVYRTTGEVNFGWPERASCGLPGRKKKKKPYYCTDPLFQTSRRASTPFLSRCSFHYPKLTRLQAFRQLVGCSALGHIQVHVAPRPATSCHCDL